MTLNQAQREAVAASGNVLLVAGAGTGKTRTLVERCVHCLLKENPRASIDEILMVTFTEAAAAEMRHRIRERLEEELEQAPADMHCREQLALFETAHIGTLHGFCLELVRQHFYLLEIDPQVSVMTQEEAHLLANERLDKLLQDCYAGRNPSAQAVQSLIQDHGGGTDLAIRFLVLRLHHYSQTLPDPAKWFEDQLEHFASAEPADWIGWLRKGIADWPASWLPILRYHGTVNAVASKCFSILERISSNSNRAEMAAALEEIRAVVADCPSGRKGDWLGPIKKFVAEAEFLASLGKVGASDPLVEDWGWVRPQMRALIDLAMGFCAEFAEVKRELGVLDFHDLEQFALRLLWDKKASGPSEIAQAWRKTFRYVFVDEYQDINAAQDKIIEALSREGPAANRFLVGDVKQSIYRFRLANPRIFQKYAREWQGGEGTVIPLVENFRSRERILQFINSVFSVIMRDSTGGVVYGDQAKLRFGAAAKRQALSAGSDGSPRVELHLRIKAGRHRQEPDEEAAEALEQLDNLEEADKEARLVGIRLRELSAARHQIWEDNGFRPIQWSDMAILLRSPAAKAESYAKEFSRMGIPLEVARCGFYESREISDLLSVFQILDNPLQDLPVLAVLRSPLVGLSVNELASIRLAARGRFWSALISWHQEATRGPGKESAAASREERGVREDERSPIFQRVDRFLKRYAAWRQVARQASLSKCLEIVLEETHYGAWLLTQRGGGQRLANVKRLMSQAQQFDRFQRQGLFRFLRFIEAQKDAEADPPVSGTSGRNAVRLMSIHQSKGLEFPLVVTPDLGKPFNLLDLRGDLILDEEFGLCPQVKPPHAGKRYPSLPFWLARRRGLRELLGEELRLLYVAMTRAQDTLILTATIPETRFAKMWKRSEALTSFDLESARNYADWLGLWFAQKTRLRENDDGELLDSLLRWFIRDDRDLIVDDALSTEAESMGKPFYESDPGAWAAAQERISWNYAFPEATTMPAKASVSMLRRRAGDGNEEADQWFETAGSARGSGTASRRNRLAVDRSAAVDSGSAHHSFLQFVSLEQCGSEAQLRTEAERLVKNGSLAGEEADLLNFETLAGFWNSEIGLKIRERSKDIRRELAFTARFSAQELAAITSERTGSTLKNEFVVVQGVADLVVLLPSQIWLVDFKTDAMTEADLEWKTKLYEPQMRLYAAAMSRIYRRPVINCWLYFLGLPRAVEVQVERLGEVKP